MIDLHERFSELDELATEDLWEEIEFRCEEGIERLPSQGPVPRRRLAIAGATAIIVLILMGLALLIASLFVSRAFCRYLCPMGAALALPARLSMFEWLKRRWQCGTPCQTCAQTCPVQAIHPEGKINPNECIHCLTCQVNYSDEELCPPLVERKRRRDRAQRAKDASKGQAEAPPAAG